MTNVICLGRWQRLSPKAASNGQLAPGKACKGMSKKHVKGEKGTAFSRCVSAAAKLRKHQHEEEQQV